MIEDLNRGRVPTRVLIAHNAYLERGGEDTVVSAESALLTERGHEVAFYHRHNDELTQQSRIGSATNAIWSRSSAEDVATIVRDFQPDVIHCHNTFPLISPSIYWAARRLRVPVVQTLHNFRLFCPQAQLLRAGLICEECIGHVPWRAVRYRCYRDSFAQSLVSSSIISIHRSLGTYDKCITRYVALNDFCRDKFIQAGLPANKICVKPNFVDHPGPGTLQGKRSRYGGLFVGRLSGDKGVLTLLDALSHYPETLTFVMGTGVYQSLVSERLGAMFLGFKGMPEIYEKMMGSSYLIVPSLWYENFPRTIVEAFSCGLPVIASRLGALERIVTDGVTGLLFDPGSAKDLAEKRQWADQNPELMLEMGRRARLEYERYYSPDENYRQLVEIYDQAIGARDD
jgi:glycosyltransferase involved in cell wall biosynthesis